MSKTRKTILRVLIVLWLMLFALLCAVAQDQPLTTIVFQTDSHPEEFSWYLVDINNDDTLMYGSDYAPNTFYSFVEYLPGGSYVIWINDTGCNGWEPGGYMVIIHEVGVPMWHVEGNFGCAQGQYTSFALTDHCPPDPCPADLDDNGIVGVSDLLIFIGEYGNTCNE